MCCAWRCVPAADPYVIRLSVLDQLMVGSVDGNIPYDSAVALLGFTPDALIGEAMDAVADKNGEALYGVIQKGRGRRIRPPRRFVEDLWLVCVTCWCLPWPGTVRNPCCPTRLRPRIWTICTARRLRWDWPRLPQMADTINATLANMTGAISPRMRLELSSPPALPVVRQAWSQPPAPSSGMPEAGHAGGAAASESQRPSGSRRWTPRNRHVEGMPWNRPRLPRIQPMPSFPERPPYWRKSSRRWVDLCRKAASRPLQPSPSRLKRSLRHPNYQCRSFRSPPSPWLSPRPSSATDDRTPDQKWDAIVAGLPEDVRHVDRWKVPPCCWTGPKGRLWIKFDKSLSKYAFAKAVAKEAGSIGTTNVVQIVRGEVYKVFGPDVTSRRPRSLPTVPPRCRGASSARKSRARSTRSWCRNS